MPPFETKPQSDQHDVLAPDGSQIQLRHQLDGGSMVYCMVPVGGVTQAVHHKTVEEFWYVVEGEGQLWRKQGDHEEIVDLTPGVSVTIPLETHFQFRNTGEVKLGFVIVTTPPWPEDGDNEAVAVAGTWEPA